MQQLSHIQEIYLSILRHNVFYLFVSHPKRRMLLSGQVCKFSYQWYLAQVPPFNTCRWHIDWIFYQFSLAAGVGVGKMEWRSPLLFCHKSKRLEKKRLIGKWATKGLFFQYWQSRVLACGSFPCIGFITLCAFQLVCLD